MTIIPVGVGTLEIDLAINDVPFHFQKLVELSFVADEVSLVAFVSLFVSILFLFCF